MLIHVPSFCRVVGDRYGLGQFSEQSFAMYGTVCDVAHSQALRLTEGRAIVGAKRRAGNAPVSGIAGQGVTRSP